MAKDKVKVSKIEIEIGDEKLSLTPKQARLLFEELRELVGDKTAVYQPNWWWVYPTTNQPISGSYKITVGDGTGAATITTANTGNDNWVSASAVSIDGPISAYLTS